jgi:hypothetical protein
MSITPLMRRSGLCAGRFDWLSTTHCFFTSYETAFPLGMIIIFGDPIGALLHQKEGLVVPTRSLCRFHPGPTSAMTWLRSAFDSRDDEALSGRQHAVPLLFRAVRSHPTAARYVQRLSSFLFQKVPGLVPQAASAGSEKEKVLQSPSERSVSNKLHHLKQVFDLEGIRDLPCECYGTVKARYDRNHSDLSEAGGSNRLALSGAVIIPTPIFHFSDKKIGTSGNRTNCSPGGVEYGHGGQSVA